MARTLTAILLLLCVGTADAQEVTLKHEFDSRTVYIEVAQYWLEVWSVTPEGCTMYPSSPDVTDTAIAFKAGTTWQIQRAENAVTVTFPRGRTVTYQRTDTEPERICGLHTRDV